MVLIRLFDEPRERVNSLDGRYLSTRSFVCSIFLLMVGESVKEVCIVFPICKLLRKKSSQPVEGLVSCLQDEIERRLLLTMGLGSSILANWDGLVSLGNCEICSSVGFMLSPTSVKEKILLVKVTPGERIGAGSISCMYQYPSRNEFKYEL
jgi:hypothetical protein